jgi:cation diffusion facilitator CzcD-associated flavoprotein CzcO
MVTVSKGISRGNTMQSKPVIVDVFVVGAGFSGLYMLYKARQIGFSALCVEAAPSVGGTWYHNRYPGARVDIESMEYSYSFSEELQQQWHWPERYSAQPDILQYANHVADIFELRKDILLSTRLKSAHWDEQSYSWQLKSEAGEIWQARYLVLSTGILSKPFTPTFPGLDAYKGQFFHTADWPHEGIDIVGKRVGVIGTGTTGMQIIPKLAEDSAQLTVFQRTAGFVVPAQNRITDPEIEKAIKSDYAGFRSRNRKMVGGYGSAKPPNMVSALVATPQEREKQFEERWNYGGFFISGSFYDLVLNPDAAVHVEEFIKRKIFEIVKNPEVAKLLLPTHHFWCKRLGVDSYGYYETFNRPNISLVDIQSNPISGFSEEGPVVAGRVHELDIVVMATGFDAVTGSVFAIDIKGVDGLPIKQKWAEGPMNYLGITINGFPNLFFTASAGSATAFSNVMTSLEHHVNYIADMLQFMRANNYNVFVVDAVAEAGWMDHVQAMAEKTTRLSCNSWYLGANVPGKPRRFMPLSGGFPAYAQKCQEVVENDYAGFSFS